MKKLPKYILYLLCFIFLVIPSAVLAKGRLPTTLPKGEVISGDYFSAGEKITLSGIVEGDAYIGGGNVLIDGVVRGDLLVGGGNVTITGEVGQDLRVGGGVVNINGRVGRNVSFAGGSIHVGKEAVISRNLNGFFGNLEHLGQVRGDLYLTGGNLHVDGQVDGSIYAEADSVELGDKARVSGNLEYESKKKVDLASGARIYGRTIRKPIEKVPSLAKGGKKSFGWLGQGLSRVKRGFSIINLLTAFFIGTIVVRLFPKRMEHMVGTLAVLPWKCIGLGFLLVLLTPVAVVLFSISVIGIPLAFVWLLGFAVFVYFAKIIVGYYIGQVLLRMFGLGERRGWALFTGLMIYYLLRFVPVIGSLVTFVVLLSGLGVFVDENFYIYKRLRVRKFL